MSRHRYEYAHRNRIFPEYLVRSSLGRKIGVCWKVPDALPGKKRWMARLFSDPTVVGSGITRDDAVDDAYRQVGGPG